MKQIELGKKVRNRHNNETGIVAATATNGAGGWVYVETQSGMSIGWWHETDIAEAPKSSPPKSRRAA